MADIFLKAGESFPLSSANNNVFGKTGGSETLLLSAGATADIDANVERVEFPGNIGDYTFLRTGTNIQVLQGTTVVVEFAGLEQTTELSFGDGTADLVLTATGAELGGAALPTGTAAAVVPVTIDATDTSSTAAAPAASLSVADVSVDENAGNATFTVTLSTAPGAGETVTVDYATSDGTATAGADYTAATGTLTFAAGITTQTITVPVTDDVAEEADETFTVTLSNVAGTISGTAATINDATATGTIVDNDTAGSTFTLTDQIDTLTGTAGNDVVIGDDDTTSAADTLDMGDGTDIFRNYGDTTIPTLNSVEALEIWNMNVDGNDLNTANNTSLETVLIKNSVINDASSTVDVTLANGEALTLENVDAFADDDQMDLSTKNASETIILNDVAGATGANTFVLNLNGNVNEEVTTLTLQGDTNNSAITVDDGGSNLMTVNLTGDASIALTIDTAITSLDTINCSTNTAGVVVTYANATDVSITGSGQNDTIVMQSNSFNADDVLDGGAGTDTLMISHVAADTAIAGDLDVTGFEVLAFATDIAANTAIDMDNVIGLMTVAVSGTNTIADASNRHVLTDIATTATTIAFTGDATDDDQAFDGVEMDWDSASELSSVTVNVSNGGVEGKEFAIQNLDLENVLAVTINAADIGTATGEELTIDDALDIPDAESLTIASNSDVVFTGGITGGDDLEEIDTTDADAGVNLGDVVDVNANFTLNMGDGNDIVEITDVDEDALTIDLGAGNDQLTLDLDAGNADISITLGSGTDTLTFDDGAALATVANNGVVEDFAVGAGGDIISGLENAAGTFTGSASARAAADLTAGGVVNQNGLVVVSSASVDDLTVVANIVDLLDGTDSVGALTAGNADQSFYVVVDNGTDSALCFVDVSLATNDINIEDNEVAIIGIFDGISDATTFLATNFANFV